MYGRMSATDVPAPVLLFESKPIRSLLYESLYVVVGRFFIDILGLMCSFGLAYFVVQEYCAKHSSLGSALSCPEGGNHWGTEDLWQGAL